MTFDTEPTGYIKTVLSDLQGAWMCLRDAVVNCETFQEQGNLIFHIDEATSWENVRDLNNMKKCLLLIRNIILKSNVDDEVMVWLEDVDITFQTVMSDIAEGKIL